MNTITSLLWKEALVLRQDRRFFVLLLAAPLILMVLLSHGMGQISTLGREGVNGAFQTVPGFTVMFSFYIITYLAISHYRDHAWGSWTLVQALGIGRLELMVAVALPYYILGCLQMLLLLVVGCALFGIGFNASMLALPLLVAATVLVIIGLGLTLLNITRSMTAMTQSTHFVVLVAGTIGGSLLPSSAMPDWTRALARATPQYWAVQGLKSCVAGTANLADVLPNVGVLLLMGCALVGVGAWRYDPTALRRVPLG